MDSVPCHTHENKHRWPVLRWNLAYKNPVFLPAITAHAVLRQKATAQTLTPAWLKKKEKAILYSLCAHSHLDPAIIEYLDSKKKVVLSDSPQHTLVGLVSGMTCFGSGGAGGLRSSRAGGSRRSKLGALHRQLPQCLGTDSRCQLGAFLVL